MGLGFGLMINARMPSYRDDETRRWSKGNPCMAIAYRKQAVQLGSLAGSPSKKPNTGPLYSFFCSDHLAGLQACHIENLANGTLRQHISISPVVVSEGLPKVRPSATTIRDMGVPSPRQLKSLPSHQLKSNTVPTFWLLCHCC